MQKTPYSPLLGKNEFLIHSCFSFNERQKYQKLIFTQKWRMCFAYVFIIDPSNIQCILISSYYIFI